MLQRWNITHFVHIESIIRHIFRSSSVQPSSELSVPFWPSDGWTLSTSMRSLMLLSVGSGMLLTAWRTSSEDFSKCRWNLSAISSLCLFCCSSITRRVSLAWWGRNSLTKWCMWMNSNVKSSILAALASDSGFLMMMSTKSRKLAVMEWFNFFNSLRWS